MSGMVRVIGIVGALLAFAAVAAAQDEPQVLAFEVEAVNPSLTPPAEPLNLETPQACVESFLEAARRGEFGRAAHALHFRVVGDVSDADAATAAERLFNVLNQELWVDWEALPDRPDGMVDFVPLGGDNPLVGQPRKSIRLGSIEVEGREIPVRVERVRAGTGEAVWLVSAQTVSNIELLYEAHGPGWLQRQMPEWAQKRVWGRVALWKWIVLVATLIIAPLVGYGVTSSLKRVFARRDDLDHEMLDRFDWPLAAVISTAILFAVIEWTLALPSAIANFVDPLALIAFIGSATWFVMRGLDLAIERVAKDTIRKLHEEESAAQQRLMTQITVVRHVMLLLIALAGFGILLLQLDLFRTLGTALLSSAGAAAVIFGIAGHAVLGNLIAGLQIALSQPFKIGDSVYVEGNYGTIEDVMYTYVIVRTWDKRRLVFPVKYFIDNWFENWSHTDSFLQKGIYLHVDYRADVERIREKFLSVLEEDEDWDGENDSPDVLVTETHDDTMVVRMTCGGATPSAAWSLECRVREKMVAWLQQVEGGAFLPVRRISIHEADRGAADRSAPSGD